MAPRCSGKLDDPQAQIGPVPALFAQDQPEDRQAPQSRHLRDARGRPQARARRAVFQARRRLRSGHAHLSRQPALECDSFPGAATVGAVTMEVASMSLFPTAWRFAALPLVLLVATPASAQLLQRKDLSYPMALTIATGALEDCKAKGYAVSVVVVDRGGDVMVALRANDAGPHTMENARRKAYTARTFRSEARRVGKDSRSRWAPYH